MIGFGLAFLLFALLPVLLLGSLSWLAVSFQEEFARREAGTAFQARVTAYLRTLDPSEFMRSRLREFTRRLLLPGPRTHHLGEALSWARREWPFRFTIAFFDEKGRLVNPSSASITYPGAVQLGWDLFTEGFRVHRRAFQRWAMELLKPFGNGFFQPRRFFPILEGNVRRMFFPETDGFMLWKRLSAQNRSGFILMVKRPPDAETVFRWNTTHRSRPPFSLIRQSPGEEPQVLNKVESVALPKDIPRTISRMRVRAEGWEYRDSCLWTVIRAETSLFLAGIPAPHLDFSGVYRNLGIAHLCLLIVLGWLLWLWIGSGRGFFFSLRLKVPFLMGYTVLIPLLVFFFLGHQKLQNLRGALLEKIGDAGLSSLIGLDNAFPESQNRFLKELRKMAEGPELRAGNTDAIRRQIRALLKERRLDFFEIRDRQFNPWLSGFHAYPLLQRLYDSFAEMVAINRFPHRLSPEQRENCSPQSRTFRDPWAAWPTNPFYWPTYDGLGNVRIGPDHFSVYHNFFIDPAHQTTLFTAGTDLETLQRKHLEQFLRMRHTFEDGQFRLLARHAESGSWLGTNRRVPVALGNLAYRARLRGGPATGLLTIRGKTFWALATPGNQLQPFDLVILFPYETVERHLGKWRTILILVGLMSLLLVLFLGSLLSRALLHPTGKIGDALMNVKTWRQGIRVEEFANDELADLALLFNRTMEKSSELELARLIQDRLFPPPSLEFGKFLVQTSYRSASQLSGDYLEVLPLPSGKVLFLIGDVVGHGVASALLMVMMKAAVKFAVTVESDVAGLMGLLDQHIRDLFRGEKLATCFMGLLDPATGDLVFSNAGHPFPLLCRSNGSMEELALARYPLGTRISRTFAVNRVRLGDGDLLLLYTDGAYEATSPARHMFGFERLRSTFRELRHLPPQLVTAYLQDRLTGFTAPAAPGDDITLLVLKGKGKTQDESEIGRNPRQAALGKSQTALTLTS